MSRSVGDTLPPLALSAENLIPDAVKNAAMAHDGVDDSRSTVSIDSNDDVAGQTYTGSAEYETDKLVHMYLDLHFASMDVQEESREVPAMAPHAGQPDGALLFPQRCGEMLLNAMQ